MYGSESAFQKVQKPSGMRVIRGGMLNKIAWVLEVTQVPSFVYKLLLSSLSLFLTLSRFELVSLGFYLI